MAAQNDWRFCTKCYSLFRYGYGAGGVCSARGSHSPFRSCSPTNAPTSWDFALHIASTALPPKRPGANPAWGPAGTQNNWRFCTKCCALFFYGFFGFAGVCPHAGQHSPLASASLDNVGTSWDFALRIVPAGERPTPPGPHPVTGPAGTQHNWRLCTKCYALFFDGFDSFAGVCARGGQHSPFYRDSPTHTATSSNFALQVASTAPAGTRLDPTIELADVTVGRELFVRVGGHGFTPNGKVVIDYEINADLTNRNNASHAGRTAVSADDCGDFETDFHAYEPGYVTRAHVEAVDGATGRIVRASTPLWTAVL